MAPDDDDPTQPGYILDESMGKVKVSFSMLLKTSKDAQQDSYKGFID